MMLLQSDQSNDKGINASADLEIWCVDLVQDLAVLGEFHPVYAMRLDFGVWTA